METAWYGFLCYSLRIYFHSNSPVGGSEISLRTSGSETGSGSSFISCPFLWILCPGRLSSSRDALIPGYIWSMLSDILQRFPVFKNLSSRYWLELWVFSSERFFLRVESWCCGPFWNHGFWIYFQPHKNNSSSSSMCFSIFGLQIDACISSLNHILLARG